MHSPGINGEGELRGQPANPGSPGKMAVKMECVCVCVCVLSGRQLQSRHPSVLCARCDRWNCKLFCVDRMSETESATAANISDSFVCPWPDCGKQYRSSKTLKDHQRIKGHVDGPTQTRNKVLCPVADCHQWWVISGFCFPLPSYGLSTESVNSFKEFYWQLTEAVYNMGLCKMRECGSGYV